MNVTLSFATAKVTRMDDSDIDGTPPPPLEVDQVEVVHYGSDKRARASSLPASAQFERDVLLAIERSRESTANANASALAAAPKANDQESRTGSPNSSSSSGTATAGISISSSNSSRRSSVVSASATPPFVAAVPGTGPDSTEFRVRGASPLAVFSRVLASPYFRRDSVETVMQIPPPLALGPAAHGATSSLFDVKLPTPLSHPTATLTAPPKANTSPPSSGETTRSTATSETPLASKSKCAAPAVEMKYADRELKDEKVLTPTTAEPAISLSKYDATRRGSTFLSVQNAIGLSLANATAVSCEKLPAPSAAAFTVSAVARAPAKPTVHSGRKVEDPKPSPERAQRDKKQQTSDRFCLAESAADTTHGRLDMKYGGGLHATNPGFDSKHADCRWSNGHGSPFRTAGDYERIAKSHYSPLAENSGHCGRVEALCVGNKNQLLVTASSEDRSIKFYHLDVRLRNSGSGEFPKSIVCTCLLTLAELEDRYLRAIALSPNSRYLLSNGSSAGALYIRKISISLRGGKRYCTAGVEVTQRFAVDKDVATSFDWHPDGHVFALGTKHGRIQFWSFIPAEDPLYSTAKTPQSTPISSPSVSAFARGLSFQVPPHLNLNSPAGTSFRKLPNTCSDVKHELADAQWWTADGRFPKNLSRLSSVEDAGVGEIIGLSFSPNGNRIIATGRYGVIVYSRNADGACTAAALGLRRSDEEEHISTEIHGRSGVARPLGGDVEPLPLPVNVTNQHFAPPIPSAWIVDELFVATDPAFRLPDKPLASFLTVFRVRSDGSAILPECHFGFTQRPLRIALNAERFLLVAVHESGGLSGRNLVTGEDLTCPEFTDANKKKLATSATRVSSVAFSAGAELLWSGMSDGGIHALSLVEPELCLTYLNPMYMLSRGEAIPNEKSNDPPVETEEEKFCRELKTAHPNYAIEVHQKDGNCLFRAASSQVYGTPDLHLRVRDECYTFMESNRAQFETFIAGPFDEYVTRNRKANEWGDHIEITSMSQLYRLPVEVFDYTHPSVPRREGLTNSQTSTPARSTDRLTPIRLSYHGHSHYNSVIDTKDKPPLATEPVLVSGCPTKEVWITPAEHRLATASTSDTAPSTVGTKSSIGPNVETCNGLALATRDVRNLPVVVSAPSSSFAGSSASTSKMASAHVSSLQSKSRTVINIARSRRGDCEGLCYDNSAFGCTSAVAAPKRARNCEDEMDKALRLSKAECQANPSNRKR